MKQIFTVALVLLLIALCSGQTRSITSSTQGRSCVDPEAMNNVTSAYYRIVSGPPGGRDWNQLRTLSLESARFDAVGINEQGKNQFHPQTREEYINHLGEYLRKYGFFQSEIKRTTECYARIAHVLSTYESRNEMKGKVIDRGIMSFQLIHDEGRWRIAHVMWNSETREHPIPARYLK
jgi:hypothetical protein